jgi:hypothetical protein
MATNKKYLKIAGSLDQPPLDSPAPFDPALSHDANPELGVDVAAADAASSDTEFQKPPIGEPATIAPQDADLVAASTQVGPGAANSPDVSGEVIAGEPFAPASHDGILTHGNNDVATRVWGDTAEPTPVTDGVPTESSPGGKAAKHYVVMAPELNTKLKRLAGSEGVSVSTLVRRVLTAFADGNPGAAAGPSKVDAISAALDRVLEQAHEVEATFVRMGVGVVDGGAVGAD